MGAAPPFLYDPPARQHGQYVAFNPKTVSQASFQPLRPKPKPSGPLVTFNRHPDSWISSPYGNTNARPMSPRTKTKVRYARYVKLFLRICELAGATALLVCLICIRKIEALQGWLLRIPPGIAILHTIYGIYHLARSSAARTPTSSASYMLFSGTVDAAAIPFYVYCVLNSKIQIDLGEKMLWTSIFGNEDGNLKMVQAAFNLGATNAAMHLVSLILSIYLAIIFRKISKLPPDMNPLEANLTSRHKKKVSSVSENRMSQATTSSSMTQLEEDPLVPPPRTIPFMHTRTSSTDSLSLKERSQCDSKRSSRADLPSQIMQNSDARSSRGDLSRASKPPNSPLNRSSQQPGSATPRSRNALLNDHWYTNFPHGQQTNNENVIPEEEDLGSLNGFCRNGKHSYSALNASYEDVTDPLKANPPTPPPNEGLIIGVANRAGTPKSRYYGELKSAVSPLTVGPLDESDDDDEDEGNWRVISTSGADYGERRDVSGKIAEEGRSNGWARYRKVSDM